MSKSLGTALAMVGSAVILAGCGGSGDDPANTTPGDDPTAKTTTGTTTTTTTVELWSCSSDRRLANGIVAADKKGFAIDDETFKGCFEEVGLWPHATEPITSLRLFSGWKTQWDPNAMEDTWKHLEMYVNNTRGKILIGTGIADAGDADERTWEWAMLLMKKFGRERIMGVAFGNELDNEYFHPEVQPWFADGRYVATVKKRVQEMDDAGFTDVPITSSWTAGVNTHMQPGGKLNGVFKELVDTYGNRWVWSHNPYSIWSQGLYPQETDSAEECQRKVDIAVGVPFIKDATKRYRDSINQFLGHENYTLWITETGWSSPAVTAHQKFIAYCPAWASTDTLFQYYQGVAEWDLSLDDGKGVDHLFMFTLRDAHGEAFGFIEKCGEPKCKIQSSPAVV